MTDFTLDRTVVAGKSVDDSAVAVLTKPLSRARRIYNIAAIRKTAILLLLALVWQMYALALNNPLLFPTFNATLEALAMALSTGELLERIGFSLKLLMIGFSIGIALAAVLTAIAIASRIGRDLLEILTSMFNPLPAIALLPLALMWFGLGQASIVFVLVHSVLWPVALNAHSGFLAVSNTLRMVGRNYGLSGIRFISKILIPAALPSILVGIRTGWAFGWRTLIAAEFVFGVSSGSGGLGWFIYENKNRLEIAAVFAGLLSVTLIGLTVETFVFRAFEARTVRRWEMQLG